MELRLDLEYSIGNHSCKSTRNLTCSIEYIESASEFGPRIERGQIIDHPGIKPRLRHTQKLSRGDYPSKIGRRRTDHSHRTKHNHGTRKDIFRAEALGGQIHRRSKQNIRDEKDRQENIVLVSRHVEIRCQIVGVCVSEVGLVDGAA